MQPHFSDPERPALLEQQKYWLDHYWRVGFITDTVYLRAMVFAGECSSDATARLSLLKLEDQPKAAEAARLEASREWMRSR